MLTATVGDVMTRDVITVEPATPFKDVVDLMVNEGISALPVVDRVVVVRNRLDWFWNGPGHATTDA